MLPTVMLSAVLSLSPPQPVLIPSDMLRKFPEVPSRMVIAPKSKLENSVDIDAQLRLYERLLKQAKEDGQPKNYIGSLQNMVELCRKLKAESGKMGGQPDPKLYEQLLEPFKKDGLPQDFIEELQKMIEQVLEKKG